MRCIVKNCGSSQRLKNALISFHGFPSMLDLKHLWICSLKLNPEFVGPNAVVCSKHFWENDFFTDKTASRRRLFPSSVPHLDDVVHETVENTNLMKDDKENEGAFSFQITENIQIVPPKKRPEEVDTNSIILNENIFFRPPLVEKTKISLKRALQPSSDELSSSTTPTKRATKDKLRILRKAVENKNKKIKLLNQKVRRRTKRVATLSQIVANIKSKNLINEETFDILENLGAMNADLFSRKLRKVKGLPNTRMYQPALRSFALNLNFLSPKAYNFVRENFNNCLPHSRTLAKWYEGIDCSPGFTTESFEAIRLAVEEAKNTSEKIILNLIFDEMAIRRHIDWSSKGAIGYTFIGDGDCSSTEASQILVFLVVCVNRSWKIPVGYFPITCLDANQKVNMIKHCLESILATGAEVIGATFDGAATNFTAARLLGSDISDISTESVFQLDSLSSRFCVLPDPCHMVKLIRNFFAEIGEFKDSDGNIIKWQYLQKLVELQEKEELHLGNKLKRAHIYFFNQKMKVRLAVQALSKSVADALDFCREVLLLPAFEGSEATVKFIRYINNVFDILNSRSMYKFGFEKAVCNENIDSLILFENNFVTYISQLRILNGQLVVNSRRKTGFVGIIACVRNIKVIYDRFISSGTLSFIPFYKLNQDHLELFFSSVRSHLGHNDNPSVKQFKAAYKKLIVRCKIREGGIGNCIPLENIEILNLSSSNPIKSTNFEPLGTQQEVLLRIVDADGIEDQFLSDHSYFSDPSILSEYTGHVVRYIAGFVVFKLESILKCNECKIDLNGEMSQQSLISFKSRGYLKIPSKSVEDVCITAEKELRIQTKLLDKNKSILHQIYYNRILLNTQHSLLEKPIFQGHIKSSGHYNVVVKLLVGIYLKTRYFYITKKTNEKPTVRQKLYKTIHFKGF